MANCRTCRGRGQWQEQHEEDGEVIMVWRFCNDCQGTGIEQDPEDGDNFDIGGSSYADPDD